MPTNPNSARFLRTSLIVDADPNTLLPGFPTGVSGMNGAFEGAPFWTPETYKEASSAAMLLAMARTPSGASAAQVRAWIYDSAYTPTAFGQPSGGTWVNMGVVTVAEGAPVSVPGIRGPNWFAYLQVLSVSGAPQALLGFWNQQP